MAHHKQVRVEHDDKYAEVDEGIAPLILVLWQRGFRTTGSCEGLPDTAIEYQGTFVPVAFIQFKTEEQARDFIEIAGMGDILSLEPEDFEGHVPDDPALFGAVGVGFPSAAIPDVLAAVRRR